MIPLSQYPRPNPNYRFCIHGSPDQYRPVGGPGQVVEYLNRCKQMGSSHMLLLTDRDGSSLHDKDDPENDAPSLVLDTCRDMGIEPVVRIYSTLNRQTGFPLDATVKKTITRLAQRGVHYFVTINEPELGYEWDGGRPDNWADVAARSMTDIALYCQSVGAIPVLFAMATGSPDCRLDIVGKMLDVAGLQAAQVFNGKWILGVHNYYKHPIGLSKWMETDRYPYDSINQEGSPCTPEFYQRIGGYGSFCWETDTLEALNMRRARDKNPGQTMLEDDCGEVALFSSAYRAMVSLTSTKAKALGIVWPEGQRPATASTEGGMTIGDRADPRYPKPDGEYHAACMVETLRRGMGTSTEKGGSLNYPDWVLWGGAWWLLGQQYLGAAGLTWESSALFTAWWPEFRQGRDHLPGVEACYNEPKVSYGGQPMPEPTPEPTPEPNPGTDVPNSGTGWQIPANLPKVALVPADVLPGETYWKLIKARWLDEATSAGRHHIYIEALDKAGHRISGIPIAIVNGGTVKPLTLPDKPLEFGMYGVLGSYTVYVALGISDRVIGMGMGTPEQSEYQIHTCFELTFQETTMAGPEPEPGGPDPSGFHALLFGQTVAGIEWEAVLACQQYFKSYRSTLTFSHDDAMRYPNVSVISTPTMPVSEDVIKLVQARVHWLEVIKPTDVYHLLDIMDARARTGNKYGI